MNRVCTLALILAGFPAVLSAYTDPGTGMLLWQSLLAVSVGLVFSTRRALARLFRRDQ
ncbi:MAG: hypothetical protein K2X03_21260 [Bryobacteraceae bacterium]|nr:hypothetical protein [Bryobacteraceae bacterium]